MPPIIVPADGAPVPVDNGVRDAVLGMVALNAVTKFAFDLGLPPRCECCFEFRHVARDTYGGVAMVCARCDYQLRATGCCHLHHGRVFYPELFKPQAVPTPVEVEALFYVPESVKPRYDAAEVEADTDR